MDDWLPLEFTERSGQTDGNEGQGEQGEGKQGKELLDRGAADPFPFGKQCQGTDTEHRNIGS